MNTVHGNTKYASLVGMEGLKVGEAMNLVLTYKALNTLRVKISAPFILTLVSPIRSRSSREASSSLPRTVKTSKASSRFPLSL